MSEKSTICGNEFDYHELMVIDWRYEPAGHDVRKHSKIARVLLCQRCFLTFDLTEIESCRKRLENI